jgi:cell division transport system permease protein
MRANFVVSGVVTGVRRNATMTVALILSTAIALGFVGAAVLTNKEIGKFKTVYESELKVSIFLCTNNAYDLQIQNAQNAHQTPHPTCAKGAATTVAQTAAIQSALKSDPRVTKVVYVTEKQNLAAAKAQTPALKDYLSLGDFPASFTITLKNITSDYSGVQKQYQAMAGVDSVRNPIDVIKRLLAIIDSARWFSVVVAVLVLVASVLLIANTIQVAAGQRRNETEIMRLVGASRWMTELPFMLETLVAVVIGGLISTIFLWVGKDYILGSVFRFPVEKGVIPNLDINNILVAGGSSLLVGIVLSGITAIVTLRFYVRL